MRTEKEIRKLLKDIEKMKTLEDIKSEIEIEPQGRLKDNVFAAPITAMVFESEAHNLYHAIPYVKTLLKWILEEPSEEKQHGRR